MYICLYTYSPQVVLVSGRAFTHLEPPVDYHRGKGAELDASIAVEVEELICIYIIYILYILYILYIYIYI